MWIDCHALYTLYKELLSHKELSIQVKWKQNMPISDDSRLKKVLLNVLKELADLHKLICTVKTTHIFFNGLNYSEIKCNPTQYVQNINVWWFNLIFCKSIICHLLCLDFSFFALTLNLIAVHTDKFTV